MLAPPPETSPTEENLESTALFLNNVAKIAESCSATIYMLIFYVNKYYFY